MAKTKTSKTNKTSKGEAPAAKAKGINPVASTSRIDIGIASGDRKEIAEGLSRYLSDAFTLYLKTHNFHWNVTGPMFNSLHNMFEQQYTEQWNALDEVAERTRALGFNTPGSYAEFIRLTSIREEPGADGVPDWKGMVQQLVAGNEAVCRTARAVLKTADDAGDDPTVDLLTQRLQTHEKYAWMLRSLLE
ncbi:Dps family protein [Pseudoxanthomonas sp. 10H]|uniref:Dps family protein n=1 Tax=Pseudoxanthomonas sp. 10H TaxID=3242729 RepID=UPI003557CF7E